MQPIETTKAPSAIGPYSQAIRSGEWVFTSGQIPLTASGEKVEGIEEQTHQVLKNIQIVLEAAGSDLSQVVKVTVFLTNLDHFAKVNAIYGTYFGEHRPARSCVEVSRLPKGADIEIEVVARVY